MRTVLSQAPLRELPNYGRLRVDQVNKVMLPLLKEKKIKNVDIAVFLALCAAICTKTNIVRKRLKHIAEESGITESAFYTSVSRLKEQLLVARYENKKTGDEGILINPHIFHAGPHKFFHLHSKRFMSCFE